MTSPQNNNGGTPEYPNYGQQHNTDVPGGPYGQPEGQAAYPDAAPYGQQPYGQDAAAYPAPQYGEVYAAPAGVESKNGFALWAMILGIIALVLTVIIVGIIVSWIPAIAAIILGIIALVKSKNYAVGNARKGMAITGIVTGALSLIGILTLAMFLSPIVSDAANDCEGVPDSEMQQCIQDSVSNRMG